VNSFLVNMPYLAAKVGELKGLSDTVSSLATGLECGGDLGPGDIRAAAQELAEQFRYGVEEMGERIGRMADSVSAAMDNYQAVEDAAHRSFASPQEYFGGRT
jgi:hypothetical protein